MSLCPAGTLSEVSTFKGFEAALQMPSMRNNFTRAEKEQAGDFGGGCHAG